MNNQMLMGRKQLVKLLDDVKQTHIAVLGDFCLDVYWEVDDSLSELSVETGLRTTAIVEQRFALGGAGCVAENLSALNAQVSLFGVIGEDPWGEELRRIAEQSGMDVDALHVQSGDWVTPAYVKPICAGKEQSRLDLGRANILQDETAEALLEALERALPGLDVIVVNQQIPDNLHCDHFRKRLKQLMAKYTKKIWLLDGRDVASAYPDAWHKMNDFEACRMIDNRIKLLDNVPMSDVRGAAKNIYVKWGQPVFVTCGARGVVVCDEGGLHEIPGLSLTGAIDTVGAGDAMLAGLAAALAAGANAVTAAQLGNYSAAVTIKKIHMTGTASPSEIVQVGDRPKYMYHADLAGDLSLATYWQHSRIELVEELPNPMCVQHIIFDHDGTLSVLREGWEAVMEPVMMQAIIGERSIDESLRVRIHRRVMRYIDDTTGIQTLAQMQGLVELVKEFELVPESQILDEHGYKAIYNAALMQVVNERHQQLQCGALCPEDYAIRGAHQFLQHCYDSGIKLYLASGTDEGDVCAEAKAMGYADLFEGRIYGAVGDVNIEAKRVVMERIIHEIGSEQASRVLAIGDGPVEMREMRMYGGISIGVASDEKKCVGMNESKRRRLIHAGAHAVITDYSECEKLCDFLNITHEVHA